MYVALGHGALWFPLFTYGGEFLVALFLSVALSSLQTRRKHFTGFSICVLVLQHVQLLL